VKDGWGVGSVTTHEDFKNFNYGKDILGNVDLRQTMQQVTEHVEGNSSLCQTTIKDNSVFNKTMHSSSRLSHHPKITLL